jgi:hypothetical protein
VVELSIVRSSCVLLYVTERRTRVVVVPEAQSTWHTVEVEDKADEAESNVVPESGATSLAQVTS